MKVLINDGMDEEGLKLFEESHIETDTQNRDLGSLVKEIAQFDGLIVRSATKVEKEILEAGANGNLKIVGRAGVGFDNIDIKSASECGIVVKWAPYGNTNSTAEHAFGLILSVSKNIAQAHYSSQKGYWRKKQFQGTEISHKTLGIIGCGRIGQRLSELVRGLDMNVIGYDAYPDKVKVAFPESRIKYASKDEVFANSDYVSIHTSGEELVVSGREISLMKPTAYLINAARGKHVDETALYEALKSNRIAGAGLDVYRIEPKEDAKGEPNFDSVFRGLENVVLTQHQAANTSEAQKKTSIEIARVVIDYLLKGDFFNAVNAGETVESEQRHVYSLFIHHRDVPGAFASINKLLGDNGINIRENPSRQLGTDGSVMTVYLVHQKIESSLIKALNGLDIVYKARK